MKTQNNVCKTRVPIAALRENLKQGEAMTSSKVEHLFISRIKTNNEEHHLTFHEKGSMTMKRQYEKQ